MSEQRRKRTTSKREAGKFCNVGKLTNNSGDFLVDTVIKDEPEER